jgi:hypothetical protein
MLNVIMLNVVMLGVLVKYGTASSTSLLATWVGGQCLGYMVYNKHQLVDLLFDICGGYLEHKHLRKID